MIPGPVRWLPRGVALGLATGFASAETTQHVLDAAPSGPVDAAWLRLSPLAELRARAEIVRALVAEHAADGREVLDAAAGTGRLVRGAVPDPRTVTSTDRSGRRSAGFAVLAWDLTAPPPPPLAGRRFGLIVLSGYAEQADDAALVTALRSLRSLAGPGAQLVLTCTPRYRGRLLLRLVPRTPRIVERERQRLEGLLWITGWLPTRGTRSTPRGRFDVHLTEPNYGAYP